MHESHLSAHQRLLSAVGTLSVLRDARKEEATASRRASAASRGSEPAEKRQASISRDCVESLQGELQALVELNEREEGTRRPSVGTSDI